MWTRLKSIRLIAASNVQVFYGDTHAIKDVDVEIEIRRIFGKHYRQVGEHEKGQGQLRQALQLARQTYVEPTEKIADILTVASREKRTVRQDEKAKARSSRMSWNVPANLHPTCFQE